MVIAVAQEWHAVWWLVLGLSVGILVLGELSTGRQTMETARQAAVLSLVRKWTGLLLCRCERGRLEAACLPQCVGEDRGGLLAATDAQPRKIGSRVGLGRAQQVLERHNPLRSDARIMTATADQKMTCAMSPSSNVVFSQLLVRGRYRRVPGAPEGEGLVPGFVDTARELDEVQPQDLHHRPERDEHQG